MIIINGKSKFILKEKAEFLKKQERDLYVHSKLLDEYTIVEQLEMIRNAVNSIAQYMNIPETYLPQNFRDIQKRTQELREEYERKTQS